MAVVENPVAKQLSLVHRSGQAPDAHRVEVVVQDGSVYGGRARRHPEFGIPGVQGGLVVSVRTLELIVGQTVDDVRGLLPGI